MVGLDLSCLQVCGLCAVTTLLRLPTCFLPSALVHRVWLAGRTVVRFGKKAVAVVRRVLVLGHDEVRKILLKPAAPIFVRILFHVQLDILFATAAQRTEVPGSIGVGRHRLDFFT